MYFHNRCRTFNNIPSGCSKVTDPADSCCLTISCIPSVGQTPTPYPSPRPGLSPVPISQIPTAVPGVITGQPGPGATPDVCEKISFIYHYHTKYLLLAISPLKTIWDS